MIPSRQRCETCTFNSGFSHKGTLECTVGNERRIIPIAVKSFILRCGCASYSNTTERDKQEKFITDAITFACEKHDDEIRDKVLNRLCEICPLLDERPDTCENCVVETVRKELRTLTPPEAQP